MDAPAFDIVFTGALVAGREPAQVKAELARLFKTDAAGIGRLFCGQPVIIKKGVDRATADKYRAVLAKAGAMCEIRARGEPAAAPPAGMTIAPAGTVLAVRRPVTPPAFDLGHMSLAAAGVDILEGVDTVVATPLFDLSAFSVAPPGSALVTASPPEPPALQDMGAWSMAEPGADIDTRDPAAAVALPDISAISLAPAGTWVVRPEERKPRPQASVGTGARLTLEVAGSDSAG